MNGSHEVSQISEFSSIFYLLRPETAKFGFKIACILFYRVENIVFLPCFFPVFISRFRQLRDEVLQSMNTIE